MKKYSLYGLVFVLLGIIIVITFFFIYLSIDIQREKIIRTRIETKIHLAEMMNEVLYSPFLGYRMGMFPGLAKSLIQEIAKFEDIVYIRVVSTNGNIVQSTIDGEWGGKIKDPELLSLFAMKTIATREEVFQKEKIKSIIYPGYGDHLVLIGFSLKGTEAMIRDMIIYHILVSLSSLLLVLCVIFLILRQEVINPVKKIIAVYQKVGKGNLDVKMKIESKTEIGELALAFNEMVDNLRESQTKLEETKNVLEIRVKSRTRELEELAQSLEAQVRERTKELQQRVDELERFHKLTVGRELKMIELKQKIQEIEQKTKTSPEKKRGGPGSNPESNATL